LKRWLAAAGTVAVRPRLWLVAIRQGVRLAPWRPRSLAYLAFRAETQYGDAQHRFSGVDVVNYLTWCRQLERLT